MNSQPDNNSEHLTNETSQQVANPQQELVEIQELLKQLPEELLISALPEKMQIIVQGVSQQFSGPIPPPNILRGYDEVQSGFAERIVAMAEKEQAHRHGVEHQALSASISVQKRGQIFALIVSLVILGGSMFLIYSGKEVSGSVLAGSSLLGLAYMFITGRKRDGDGAAEKKS